MCNVQWHAKPTGRHNVFGAGGRKVSSGVSDKGGSKVSSVVSDKGGRKVSSGVSDKGGRKVSSGISDIMCLPRGVNGFLTL